MRQDIEEFYVHNALVDIREIVHLDVQNARNSGKISYYLLEFSSSPLFLLLF